jgi:hypothetical protein
MIRYAFFTVARSYKIVRHHHGNGAYCAGFSGHNRDGFAVGQKAKRLPLVEFAP